MHTARGPTPPNQINNTQLGEVVSKQGNDYQHTYTSTSTSSPGLGSPPGEATSLASLIGFNNKHIISPNDVIAANTSTS